jgi:hypothetical protein
VSWLAVDGGKIDDDIEVSRVLSQAGRISDITAPDRETIGAEKSIKRHLPRDFLRVLDIEQVDLVLRHPAQNRVREVLPEGATQSAHRLHLLAHRKSGPVCRPENQSRIPSSMACRAFNT